MHRGIHHVTAIAGSTRRNLGFYTDVLAIVTAGLAKDVEAVNQ